MAKKKERVLSLARQFRAMDTKHRDFVETLNEEERKEFSTFMSLKYVGNVDGIPELQSWYLAATNERVNKHYFSLSRHPKLQWLLCTTVSPNMGVQNHYWMRPASNKRNLRAYRFLEMLHPTASEEEIELLVSINTEEDLKSYARDLGWDEKRIRDEL